jgi:uncharacterized protein
VSNLPFPEKILHQHIATLGKTGAGKSSAMRVIAEHLLDQKKRLCIVDPKGDWWGLKAGADGKSAGYPIIVFGDCKEPRAQDVPINEHSGPNVAELIATGNRPAIVSFRGWMPAQMLRFWIGTKERPGFAQTLFNKNEGELYVLIDEVHNFAPKGRVMDPDSGKSVHWTNRIMSEGRGLGLTFFIASQRSQKVHNDTLDCCETLNAMRVTHPAAREAIKNWIDGNADPSIGKDVLTTIAGLNRGESWIWSPENDFGPKRIQFPMFQTFDSFAPPQVQKKVSTAGWSEVNLDQVREKLASVIAEAKANDPKELKQEVARLKAELLKKQPVPVAAKPIADPKAIDRAVAAAVKPYREMLRKIKQHADRADRSLPIVRSALEDIVAATAENAESPSVSAQAVDQIIMLHPPAPRPSVNVFPQSRHKPERANGDGHGEPLPKGEQIILCAIAQYPEGAQRDQLTVLTGYKRSTRDAYIQRLREKDFVAERGNGVFATEAGIAALGSAYEPLPTGEALQQYWINRLPEGERKIFSALLEAPQGLSRESLEQLTGYKRSTRDAYIQRLQSRRLVEIMGRGEVRPSEMLFA